jgi:proteasome lid subunit RPN8/RPN11
MQFTLTLTELIFQQVIEHLVAQGPNEAAGYLFVRVSRTPDETRLIGREYWPISNDELNERSPVALSIKSTSYTRALRHAHETRQAFWLVHSHPQGFESFSTADDETEAKLFPCAYVRIRPDVGPHGSLVFPTNGNPFGRVWLEDGSKQNLQRIRIIGRRFRFFSETKGDNSIPSFYDRQVRAFGPDVQKLLRDLHIGVVGCGGTGSAVCEQLIRLGIGRLTVFDGKTFAKSNVNRMYGSRVTDEGVPKVQLMERLAKDIGVGTEIQGYSEVVHHQSAAEKLREAEILFGCTDDELGRSILNQVSLRYAIPLFDMGVKIGSENGAIQWVIGRVTVVQPGNACLLCRGRITAKRIAAEALHLVDP